MPARRKAALYFGSFNPIHRGHLAILTYLLEHTDADEVRIVVSPESPFKEGYSMTAAERLANVRRVIAQNAPQVIVSDVEFHLEKPLYTINTLQHIISLEPDIEPVIVMGGDNIVSLEKWHCGVEIIRSYEIWVYPREGFDAEKTADRYRREYGAKGITVFKADLHNISSTMVRSGEAEGL